MVKSIALKAKKEYSDDETSTSESDDEEYVMAIRNFKRLFRRKSRFVRRPREKKKSSGKGMIRKSKSDRKCFRCDDPNHLIGESPNPPWIKEQKSLCRGSPSSKGGLGFDKNEASTSGTKQVCLRIGLEPSEWIKDNDLRSDVAACASSKLISIANRSQKGSNYVAAYSKHPGAANNPLNGSKSTGNVTQHAKVKRKVSMEEKTIVWEVETDFASPLKPAWDDVVDPGSSDIGGLKMVDDLKQSNDVGNILNEETVGASGTNVKRTVVNSNNNNGFNGGVHSGTTHFKSEVTKKVNFRSLVNEERVDNYDTVLFMVEMENVKNKYANSLVGYFVGKIRVFPIVQNYVNNMWAKFGLQKLMKNEDGVFLFKFASRDGLDRVLERSPWIIRNTSLILNRWISNVSLKRDECPKSVNYLDTPSDKCTNIVKEPVNASTVSTNSDGFTKVKRKKNKGTNKRGADMDTTTQVGANDINKAKGPSTSNSFDALNNMDVGADCGVSSSKGFQKKEPEAGLKTSQ
ncbi:zf-CCHC domain-containing protein [Tanacetum coccineum]|uniref:Zf-CCHC domain-containing protein n=1 Tax=Tanacetum coccineum TaxID=301880 RepID=A0ABQ4YYD0_9ASTR